MLRTLRDAGFAYGYALRERQYDPLRDDPRFKQMQADEEARADANSRVFASRKP